MAVISCDCGLTAGCERCRPDQGITHFVGDDCPGGHATEAEKGFKFDEDKLRYDLIPQYPLEELARVYTDGAKKYGDQNYLKGMTWSRVLGALLRHVEAFRAGESVDPESGHPHLAHAAWQCFTLMLYDMYSLGEDDRLFLVTKMPSASLKKEDPTHGY